MDNAGMLNEPVLSWLQELKLESRGAAQYLTVLDQVLQQAPFAITIIEPGTYKVLSANRKYLEIVDKQESEFVGRSLFDSLPEVKDIVLPLFEQVIANGQPYHGRELAVPLSRFGSIATAYFNFTYQPIVDQSAVTTLLVVAHEITDLVNARLILEEQHQKFKTVVQQSPIAMAVFKGRDMVIEMLNEVMATQVLGRKQEELVGRKLTEVYPELLDQKFPALLDKVYSSGIPFREAEAMLYLHAEEGRKTFYFDFEFSPVKDPGNDTVGIMLSAYDVTEKRQNRIKTEKAEEMLRLATKHGNVAVWDVDLATDFLSYSDNYPLLFGMPAHARLGRNVFAGMIHPEDEPLRDKARLEMQSSGSYEYNARFIIPDGEIRWLSVSGRSVLNEDGKPVRMLGTIRDITLEKKHEQTIAEHSEKLEMVLNASELGTWELDPATYQFSCNEKTRRIFGLTDTKNVDLDLAIAMMYPPDRERVTAAIREAFDPGTEGKYDITYTVLHASTKQEIIVNARGRCYFDKAKKPVRFAGTIEDVTEKKAVLRRNEKLLQLVANSKDYVSMATEDGRMTYINSAGRELLGLDASQDVSSLTVADFYSPQSLVFVKEQVLPHLQKTKHWSGQVKVRHFKTGEDIPCHANYMIIHDPETNTFLSRGLTLRDLRPEIEARKELAESEQRFTNLVHEAPVATAIYAGPNMIIQWANDSMIRLWGKSPSVIGSTVRQALPELEGQPFHDLLKRVYEEGVMYEGKEDRADLVVDGRLQTFYFNFSYKPLRDSTGKVYSILNMAVNVTEQVIAKQKLAESESRLRIAAASGELGMWDLDVSTNKMNWDTVARQLFDFEENAGISLDEFFKKVHPEDREALGKKVTEALSQKSSTAFESEFRILTADGERWLSSKGKTIVTGGQASRFSGTLTDITEKRKALMQLQASERKFRLLADSLPQIIWTADENGMIQYFNNSVTSVTGIEVHRLIGELWLQVVHPEDRLETLNNWQKAIAEKTMYQQEHRILQSDGSYRWHSTKAAVHISGSNYTWVGTTTDMHEHKTSAENLERMVAERTSELNAAVKELTTYNEELKQFAYVASHDLQEPLRKIQTFTNLIGYHGKNLDQRNQVYLEKINRSAARMQSLIQDLLSYSRVNRQDDGATPVMLVDVDLNEIVSNIRNDFELKIEQKKAIILTNNLPVIKGIPLQINQLFYNLIGNALKFSKEQVLVEISCVKLSREQQLTIRGLQLNRDYYHIIVTDNGIGFDPQYSERIFMIFQRLNSTSDFEGTGIGLAICKKVMENHGGAITAESQEGSGSTFHVYFPAE